MDNPHGTNSQDDEDIKLIVDDQVRIADILILAAREGFTELTLKHPTTGEKKVIRLDCLRS